MKKLTAQYGGNVPTVGIELLLNIVIPVYWGCVVFAKTDGVLSKAEY